MQKTIIVAAAIAAVIILKSARDAGALDTFYDPEDQTGSVLDALPSLGDLSNMATDAQAPIDATQADTNTAAMLAAIRAAEGTASDEGYYALFGWAPGNGKTFSTSSHPGVFFNYTDRAGKTIRTSAAGAYQITKTTFDALCSKYAQFADRDFSPAAQDAMAVTLIRERGALTDVQAGRFDIAVSKIRSIWASLPGAGANQPERTAGFVQNAYAQAGGTFA